MTQVLPHYQHKPCRSWERLQNPLNNGPGTCSPRASGLAGISPQVVLVGITSEAGCKLPLILSSSLTVKLLSPESPKPSMY